MQKEILRKVPTKSDVGDIIGVMNTNVDIINKRFIESDDMLGRISNHFTRTETRFDGVDACLDKEFANTNKRFDAVDAQFGRISQRFEVVDERFIEMKQEFNQRFDVVDKRFNKLEERFDTLEKKFDTLRDTITKVLSKRSKE